MKYLLNQIIRLYNLNFYNIVCPIMSNKTRRKNRKVNLQKILKEKKIEQL